MIYINVLNKKMLILKIAIFMETWFLDGFKLGSEKFISYVLIVMESITLGLNICHCHMEAT
jgi:hypothetical protein